MVTNKNKKPSTEYPNRQKAFKLKSLILNFKSSRHTLLRAGIDKTNYQWTTVQSALSFLVLLVDSVVNIGLCIFVVI